MILFILLAVLGMTGCDSAHLVKGIGAAGYVVVDADNQIDMEHADQMMEFITHVDQKEKDKLTFICVGSNQDFIRFDLQTRDGNVYVTQSYLVWNDTALEIRSIRKYEAYTWEYTKEGYLFFEEYQMAGYDGPSGYTGVRVQPLDATCRKLNQQYMMPIAYDDNNLFLFDWDETDFGNVDFYDIFDALYPQVYETPVPYVADDNTGVGAIYQIPREEFEKVIRKRFQISSETLQSKTKFRQEEQRYEYRPRGIYDCGLPNEPVPEVVDYEENPDGTITLMVHVVSRDFTSSKVYAHEVVIRPLENGEFQYVSNRILPTTDQNEKSWYVERMTDEEWDKTYQETTYRETKPATKGYSLSIDAGVPTKYSALFVLKSACQYTMEKTKAEKECFDAMERVFHIYKNADKGMASNVVLSEETMEQMQEELKDTESPVISKTAYANMENYEAMEGFLEACTKAERSSVILYEIHADGGIRRMKYTFDGTNMYVLSAKGMWSKENEPQIVDLSYDRIKEWKYTEKGWFSYERCVPEYPEVTEVVDGSRMIRVRPMNETYRVLSQKYVFPLGYQGSNILYSDWNGEHLEGIDYNKSYEQFYQMKYGEMFPRDKYSNGIPKEEFEQVLMEYLPITAKQIQEYAIFEETAQVYPAVKWGSTASGHTFFGTSIPEIVGVKENENGTITFTVDAVCEMMLRDDAVITHELTIKLREDGTFQYMENKVLRNGLENVYKGEEKSN